MLLLQLRPQPQHSNKRSKQPNPINKAPVMQALTKLRSRNQISTSLADVVRGREAVCGYSAFWICQYSSSIGAWRPKMVTNTRTKPLSGRTSSTVPS